MTRNLHKALKDQKKKNKQEVLQIAGSLGIPISGQRRVEVPSRNSYVFVRLRDNPNEVIQAFNNKVAASYNLPVIVERQDNRYIVVGVDTVRYQSNWNSFAPYLARHGNTHSFPYDNSGGGDTVFVYPRQFMPALIMPSGSSGAGNVIMNGNYLKNTNGTWRYVGPTGTPNFLPYKPTGSSAVMVLAYLDSLSGNPYLLVGSGAYFSSTITGSAEITPYVPTLSNPDYIPLSAIRLVSGTSVIGWDNIYDVRQFIHIVPTGTGGGGAATGTNYDATYLRLDTTNNPLTDQLNIDATAHPGDGGVFALTEGDSYTGDFEQLNSSQNNASSPAMYIYREITNNKTSNAYHLFLDEVYGTTGTFSGGTIRNRINGTERMLYNPHMYATGTSLLFDTVTQMGNTTGKLLALDNSGTEKFTVYGNGSVNIPSGSSYNIDSIPIGNTATLLYPAVELQSVIDSASGAYYYGLAQLPDGSSSSIATSSIGTSEVEVVGFLCNPFNGFINTISRGNFRFYITSRQTAGTRTVTLKFKVYQVTNTGTETLLYTSQSSAILTGVATLHEMNLANDVITLGSTGRLGVRIYAVGSSTGTDASISTQWGTASNERLEIPAPTDLAKYGTNSGWVPFVSSWNGATGSIFTMTKDWTPYMRPGTFLRYKDGGSFEYGVVGSSSYSNPTTTVRMVKTTDYVMATGTTITDTWVSYVQDPEGWPDGFSWTPTVSFIGGTTDPTSVVIDSAKWRIQGKIALFVINATLTRGSGDRQYTLFSLPPPFNFSVTYPATGLNNGVGGVNLNSSIVYISGGDIVNYHGTMINSGNYYISLIAGLT